MLRLDHITKVYPVKDNPVYALKGISINFRKNEFVSILGPSGCGKTTTLNIIGGLDHYTDGDLVINGVSTKQYTDRDWDVYRNHKIGFVFQSYNLIPHETILENVELALTIAGMEKEERIAKAKKALDDVGLTGMYAKHPNQLSGGQCQRVAIARALVNEPDILLADEPTGALDSETSIQIMDLIKEISKEKLVIMVTHNPNLAERYSTRIIELLDGEVKSDSAPYSLEEEEAERAKTPALPSVQEKAKMSWWTAFKLSAKNLWSKFRRTSLIVVASSIGIVGVSAVLAVSQGVRGYIASIQDDMLSGNPVTVSESGLDLASLMSATTQMSAGQALVSSYEDGKIDIQFMMEALIKTDDTLEAASVKNVITPEYLRFVDDMPEEYYAAIAKEYGLNIKNNLYTTCDMQMHGHEESDLYSISCITTMCQNILEVLQDGKFSAYSGMVDQYTDAIGQCLDAKDYVLSQYDVVAGEYPDAEDEVVLVLNHHNQISEFILTLLGYYSQDEFTNAAYHFSKNEELFDPELWEKQQAISIDDLLGKEFYYYPNDTVFTKNPGYGKEYTEDTTCYQPYLYDYLADPSWTTGMKMKITGVLTPKPGTNYGCMDAGLYYTPAFAKRFLQDNLQSKIASFISDFVSNNDNKQISGYSSMVITQKTGIGNITLINGIGYDFSFQFEGKPYHGYGLVGSQNGLTDLLASMGGGSSSGSSSGTGLSILKTATLSLRDVGGEDLPSKIKIYPKNFDSKYLVTDYLDQWGKGDIVLSTGETIALADQTETHYTDNLEVVISIINGIIDIVTIALICFTALSLVVSTVMIGIITYVSVMERVKEIGVIRSLGGRKRDVSHLFNAETLMIGAASGLFGLALTYVLELILNLTVGRTFNIGMIANLQWWTALIVFAISILLTIIAGLIPSRAAAKQDPVNALRTE
ncbi:MAG: ATP-binding cassette domain-containing protein [Candidatus Enteromonas sp.]